MDPKSEDRLRAVRIGTKLDLLCRYLSTEELMVRFMGLINHGLDAEDALDLIEEEAGEIFKP